MITEFDMVDHMMLDEENHQVLMLIVDTQDLWRIEASGGLFNFGQKRKIEQKQLEHLVCLKKKVENYIGWIQADALKEQFPGCDSLEGYNYDIHIITDFVPDSAYMDLINKMNQYISTERNDIVLTHEQKNNEYDDVDMR